MFFRNLPEKWHLHCKAMLFAVDPGTATPDTQLHASQLINTSALTAQKKSHQWPGYVYQRSWTGLFIPQWQRLLYSLGTDVNGVSLLSWMNPVPALTGTFNTDWQELQLPQRPLTRIRQVQKHNFYSPAAPGVWAGSVGKVGEKFPFSDKWVVWYRLQMTVKNGCLWAESSLWEGKGEPEPNLTGALTGYIKIQKLFAFN